MRRRTAVFAAAAAAVAAVAVVGVGTALATGTGLLGNTGPGGAGHLATVLTPDDPAEQGSSVERPEPTDTDEPSASRASAPAESREPAESPSSHGLGRPPVDGHPPVWPSTGRHDDTQESTTTGTPGRTSDD